MATPTLHRASWSLQVPRSSKSFAVSTTTGLRRPAKSYHTLTQISSPFYSRPSFARSRHARTPQEAIACFKCYRSFSVNNSHRAQQAEQASSTTKKASLEPQPHPSPETISSTTSDLSNGLNDQNLVLEEGSKHIDWARSFHGLSTEAFSPEAAKALLAPIDPEDIEIKPDGIIYLPEIKYRRILNQAFGPGGWGLAPRGETIVTAKAVTREYALVALGRLVSVARGEQDYFSPEMIPTAVEGCKSSALRRCCKDLGVASELWDPKYIRKFLATNSKEVFVEHQQTKKRRKIFMRKDEAVKYPYKEVKYGS